MEIKESPRRTDEALIMLAQNGCAQSLEALIHKYRLLAAKKAGEYFLKGSEDSDLGQEAMIGLLGAVKDFDATKKVPFAVFADICMTRSVISAVKKADRQKHRPLNGYLSFELVNEKSAYFLKVSDPTQEAIEYQYFKQLLKDFYKELSSFEQDVFRLHLKENSYKEIASKLSKSEKAVDNAIQRIRKKAAHIKKWKI